VLPSSWHDVRRVLVIHLGDIEDVVLTSSALRALRQSLPAAVITLMTLPGVSQLAFDLPCVDRVLVYESAGFPYSNAEHELAAIELISRNAFDAAVIFTNPQESPYPLAYICYLAGIPIRLGQSQEFGGGLLSDWVKLKGANTHPEDQHLFLLSAFSSAGQPLEPP
jgi:ADP-heptose:LPS heptosyltransferase